MPFLSAPFVATQVAESLVDPDEPPKWRPVTSHASKVQWNEYASHTPEDEKKEVWRNNRDALAASAQNRYNDWHATQPPPSTAAYRRKRPPEHSFWHHSFRDRHKSKELGKHWASACEVSHTLSCSCSELVQRRRAESACAASERTCHAQRTVRWGVRGWRAVRLCMRDWYERHASWHKARATHMSPVFRCVSALQVASQADRISSAVAENTAAHLHPPPYPKQFGGPRNFAFSYMSGTYDYRQRQPSKEVSGCAARACP
jgi:hypothetical protein